MEPGSHTIDREKLILGCEDQVKLLARKMACRLPGLHIYDDLLSVAWIGAIKAVDRFEPGAGKLSTYVGFKVRGAILDYLRSLDPLKREHRQLVKKSVGTNFMHGSEPGDERSAA
jgi:RNA polymerase sigma factor for flagellar operon FliA